MKLEHFVEDVIKNNKIKTQTELVKHLEKSGIPVTQSNLSRVLKKINAVKIVDENRQSYYTIQPRPLETEGWIKNLVHTIEDNGCNIVIQTYAGAANVVAKVIDERSIDGILGTVAGDDAIIIAPINIKHIGQLKAKLQDLLM